MDARGRGTDDKKSVGRVPHIREWYWLLAEEILRKMLKKLVAQEEHNLMKENFRLRKELE